MNWLHALFGDDWMGFILVLVLAILYITVVPALFIGTRPKKKEDRPRYHPILSERRLTDPGRSDPRRAFLFLRGPR
jgi:hypothetical protein